MCSINEGHPARERTRITRRGRSRSCSSGSRPHVISQRKNMVMSKPYSDLVKGKLLMVESERELKMLNLLFLSSVRGRIVPIPGFINNQRDWFKWLSNLVAALSLGDQWGRLDIALPVGSPQSMGRKTGAQRTWTHQDNRGWCGNVSTLEGRRGRRELSEKTSRGDN